MIWFKILSAPQITGAQISNQQSFTLSKEPFKYFLSNKAVLIIYIYPDNIDNYI